MELYTSLIIIEALAALVMASLILQNPVVDLRMRRDYCLCFLVLVVIVSTEWFNIFLNGSAENLRTVHKIVKCTEFCFVPVLPAIAIMAFGWFKYTHLLMYLNAIHILAEIASCFTGNIFYMDEANVYHRGNLYFLFVGLYAFEMVILFITLIECGKTFQTNNYLSVIIGCVFLVSGICIQLYDTNIKTAWLTVEMALIFSYIYFNEMVLQTDKLTGLLNRWCYEIKFENVNYDTVICVFDVDSFKSINDAFGHLLGDEALKKSAKLIKKYFGKEAKCYRIGGDEFCAIFDKDSKYATAASKDKLEDLLRNFSYEAGQLHIEDPRFTGISVGYSYVTEKVSIKEAFEMADKYMYRRKETTHGN